MTTGGCGYRQRLELFANLKTGFKRVRASQVSRRAFRDVSRHDRYSRILWLGKQPDLEHVVTHIRVVSALLIREMDARFGSKPGGYVWASPYVYTFAFLTLFIGMVIFTSSSALLRNDQ